MTIHYRRLPTDMRMPNVEILDIGTFPRPPEWTLDATCASTDPEIFFPGKGGSTRDARRVCRTCPVTAECLEYAMDYESSGSVSRDGVYGGTTPRQRMALQAKRDDADADLPLLTCPDCPQTFRRRKALAAHRRHRHQDGAAA